MKQALICVMLAVLLTLMASGNASARRFGGCMHHPNGCWYDPHGGAHTHPKGSYPKGLYTNPYKQK